MPNLTLRKLPFCTTLLTAALLTACGGSSAPTTNSGNNNSLNTGNSTATNTQSATSLTGSVLDGYIKGATVCVDVNNNQACDSDEPSAVTQADGTYKLDVSKLTISQLKTSQLLTIVPDSALDSDDNGQTLAQAGKTGYTLMAPAAAYVTGAVTTAAVISPLTTLISSKIIQGGKGLSYEDARKGVLANLNLPDNTDLTQDFIKNKREDLHNHAQMIAASIAEVKKQLKEGGTNPTEQQALLGALKFLEDKIPQLMDQAAQQTASTNYQKVKEALKATELKPDNESLLKQSQILASVTDANVETVLKEGFYQANCLRCTGTWFYNKISGVGGAYSSQWYHMRALATDTDGTSWTLNNNDPFYQQTFLTTNGSWVKQTADGTYSILNNNSYTNTNNAGIQYRNALQEINISGKPLRGFDDPNNGNINPETSLNPTTTAAIANYVFPTGSKGYTLYRSPMQDTYFYRDGFSVVNSDAPYTSLTSFMADTKNAEGLVFNTIDKTVIMPIGASGRKVDYSIITVNGVEFLQIRTAELGRPIQPVYFVKDGVVNRGSFIRAGTQTIATGMNRLALDQLLSSIKRATTVS